MKTILRLSILIIAVTLSICSSEPGVDGAVARDPSLISEEKRNEAASMFKVFDTCGYKKYTFAAVNMERTLKTQPSYKICEPKSVYCLFKCVMVVAGLMSDGKLDYSLKFEYAFRSIFEFKEHPERRGQFGQHYLECHKEKAETVPSDSTDPTCESTKKFFSCILGKFMQVCPYITEQEKQSIDDARHGRGGRLSRPKPMTLLNRTLIGFSKLTEILPVKLLTTVVKQ